MRNCIDQIDGIFNILLCFQLGIREIFTTNATLPLLARGGASENKLMVSNIIQKSGIVVDEKGTIAYAATGKFIQNILINKHSNQTIQLFN